MPMNSMEEDALFAEWGWTKDLIQRKWIAPDGARFMTFDEVTDWMMTGPEAEAEVIKVITTLGRKQS